MTTQSTATTSKKSRVRAATAPKELTASNDNTHLDVPTTLAQKYLDLKEREEIIKEEREALNELVREHVNKDGELVTSLGNFVIQKRRSLSWTLDTIKDIFSRNWVSFVVPDQKTLKARMEEKDDIGRLLEVEARVVITEAVTFSKK